MLSQQRMYQTGSGAALTDARPNIFLTTMQHCPDVVYNIYQKVFFESIMEMLSQQGMHQTGVGQH